MKSLIIAGRGCLSATQELRAFVKRYKIPVVCSLPAVGAIPSTWPEYLGMLGHTGTERANNAVADAEVIYALGTRLDIRQVGTETNGWEKKTVVLVDYDANELANKRVRIYQPIHGSVLDWLRDH